MDIYQLIPMRRSGEGGDSMNAQIISILTSMTDAELQECKQVVEQELQQRNVRAAQGMRQLALGIAR